MEHTMQRSVAGTDAADVPAMVTLWPVGFVAALSGGAALMGAEYGLVSLSLLFGWTQIGGRCGATHVNTMKMLSVLNATVWRRALLFYSLSGMVSSLAIGAFLGVLGSLAPGTRGRYGWAAAFVGAVLTLREFGVLKIGLPQRDCQTDRNWAYQFSWPVASGMWGFHIGLGVATVITYGGFWLLFAAILAWGDPRFGAAVMGTYWVGRALPLWYAHHLPQGFQVDWRVTYKHFRTTNALALAWGTFLVAVMASVG